MEWVALDYWNREEYIRNRGSKAHKMIWKLKEIYDAKGYTDWTEFGMFYRI